MSARRRSKLEGVRFTEVHHVIARRGVVVTTLILRVLEDGTVVVERCEYEEEVTA